MTGDKIPRDIVPPAAPTREQMLWANSLLGQPVRIVQPGMLIESADGECLMMGPETVLSDMTLAAPLQYTRRQLAAAGVLEEEVPHVRIVD